MTQQEWEAECAKQALRREGFTVAVNRACLGLRCDPGVAQSYFPDPPRPMRPREVTDANGYAYRIGHDEMNRVRFEYRSKFTGDWSEWMDADMTAAIRDLCTGPSEEPA